MRIFAKRALLPEGWAARVAIDADRDGTIAGVTPNADATGSDVALDTIVPAMANLHSHAFQRAMAGHGERRTSADDDFWSWREAMYALATTLDPLRLHAIALAAYRAMVRAGYTAVAEFHYLHRDPRGVWYDDRCAMAEALVCAAREAGIAICLLPALYAHADPAGGALDERQARFATGVDDVLSLAAEMRARYASDDDVTVGACAHSLRAVTPRELAELVAGSPPDVPIHIHVAEQEREVDAVRAALGARPVELLLDGFDVDERWCLVHATHVTTGELEGLARSGAVAGLCPTTEANLGDGLFGFAPFTAAGGSFGIGSDSNVSISAVEELRLLEYGQRLAHRRRVVAAREGRSCGEFLYTMAAHGGARATGFRTGALAAGMRADLIELPASDDDPDPDSDLLDRYVFGDLRPQPARVMTRGRMR